MDTKLLQSALLFVIAAAALLNAFGTYRIAINLAESGNATHTIVIGAPVVVDGAVGVKDTVNVGGAVTTTAAAPAAAPQ